MTANESFLSELRGLPSTDRRLITTLSLASLVALFLGMVYAAVMVIELSGMTDVGRSLLYKILTLHGATVFYYWLYFVQAGAILAVLLVYADVDRLYWRKVAWAGTALMIVGFVGTHAGTLAGAALSYTALAGLAEILPGSKWFYLGYTLLAVGLGCLAVASIKTALVAKRTGDSRIWESLAFASVLWWGLVGVSVVASLNAYLPPLLTQFGIAVSTPMSYLTNWHVLFHNMHYLPLVSTVIVWYVVSRELIGVTVKDVYSSRFSKMVFAFYLMLVPPTSLYHMFLSPDLSALVKTTGSFLALFMSIPTILHFLLIVTSIETAARSSGNGGVFRWIRSLPWANPSFSCVGWAVACSIGGAILSNVLVQHGFAELLSDTFFVPAYFHFLTVGTVSLTFLGFLAYLLPTLLDTPLPRPTLLARLPALVTVGVYVFGIAGTLAGYYGVPRRTLSFSYRGGVPESWVTALTVTAVGGLLMLLGIAGFVVVLLSMFAGRSGTGPIDLPTVSWGANLDPSHRTYSGIVTITVLLVGWFVMTIGTSLVMEGLTVR